MQTLRKLPKASPKSSAKTISMVSISRKALLGTAGGIGAAGEYSGADATG
jgi:hypothetical protein